jgi:hypothetical protein
LLKKLEEADFPVILAEPLQIVMEALQAQNTWYDMLRKLPDKLFVI